MIDNINKKIRLVRKNTQSPAGSYKSTETYKSDPKRYINILKNTIRNKRIKDKIKLLPGNIKMTNIRGTNKITYVSQVREELQKRKGLKQ